MKELIAVILAAIAALCASYKEAPEETSPAEAPGITQEAPSAPVDGTDVFLSDL